MAVSVSTNLTKVTISSAGVQGPKGDVGDSGTQDVSGLASTASLNQFTSSYLTDSASFANRLNNATNEQDLSTYLSASVFNNKTGSFATTSSFNNFTSSYLTDSASFATRLNNATNEQDLSTYLSASVFNNKTGSFTTTSSFNSFTSSYLTDSASFANRIESATNEQDLSTYLSASVFNNKTGSFATTGSNTFIGNQTITGSLRIEDDNNFSKINGFKFSLANATPNLIGNLDSVGIYAGYDIENDITTSLASNRILYITVGESSNYWTFGRDGILTVPGNITGAHNLAITGSNIFVGNQTISGSIYVSGSNSTIVLPNHASAPSSPNSGALYFNTTDFHFYGWDGGQWKQLDN